MAELFILAVVTLLVGVATIVERITRPQEKECPSCVAAHEEQMTHHSPMNWKDNRHAVYRPARR